MKSLAVILCVVILSGCSALSNVIPPFEEAAVVIEDSATLRELKALPKPMGKIPVSVYAFRDQTGQYKPSSGARCHFNIDANIE